ncbi:MAG: hypothetical protein HOC70_09160 [Gammaproteobacteria bacterium]|jgi:hypothetical protein|nr:hypothetical protein [Gammaproteobacteria bacterium]MBT4493403.1 hypothetical protein [Gammaproteobacteria bacterium]MBT7371843.1 hypothetical protein [Gammaproteobacteria bacterium]
MNKVIPALLLFVTAPVFSADTSNGPVMRLFPTTVLEDIRETGEVAEKMEDNLQDVISRLDLQQQLYNESQCAGADDDQGCDRIARQLGATYLEMLESMEERLPAMADAVNNTKQSLAKRLKQELGQKSTPNKLQDLLLGRIEKVPTESQSVALRGRSGIRLSNRFKQYYNLVATRNSGPTQSLAVVASDIYLDMEEASNLIVATREEISRAALMEQLNQSFGQITPEMNEVVSGVKSILFGEEELTAPIAALPDRSVETAFISPLEI